jgi:hypothetical protein
MALPAVLAVAMLGCGLSPGAADSKSGRLILAGPSCTKTLEAGANLANALARARPKAVLCLRGGSYPGVRVPPGATDAHRFVTLRSAPGESAVIAGELSFDNARFLCLRELKLTGGVAFRPAAAHVRLLDNEITGEAGIFFYGDASLGGSTRAVLIEGNHIHDIDYRGSQSTYNGYGIKSIGVQNGFTVRGNTIERLAADYIQTDVARNWTVDRNTFLGPSLAGTHPTEHQDLWQIYAGGRNISFTNNVARDTGTSQSLLFQMTYPENRFAKVSVVNNLFDHDSDGYTCQLYQSAGLVFRHNTIVGSEYGCIFRAEPGFPDGSGYRVERNILDAHGNSAIGFEGGAQRWGTYAYNVSTDGSARGPHSIRHWRASWSDDPDYQPRGLPFAAGYRQTG